MNGKFLPQQIVPIAATKAAGQLQPHGNGEDSWKADFDFKVAGIEIEGLERDRRWTCSIPGRIRRGVSIEHADAHEFVLHRQVSGDQCGVQEVSGCDALPSER